MKDRTVHIYRLINRGSGKGLKRREQIMYWIIKAVSVACLVAAWWQCFRSVFTIKLEATVFFSLLFAVSFVCTAVWMNGWKKYTLPISGILYFGILWTNQSILTGACNHLANAWIRLMEQDSEGLLLYREGGITPQQMAVAAAVITVPVIAMWALASCTGKGRILSGLLIVIPIGAAAAAGYFPSKSACFALLLAAGLYMAVSSGRTEKAVGVRAAAAVILLLVTLVFSSFLGDKFEQQKALHEEQYRQARAAVSGKVREMERLIKERENGAEQKKEDREEVQETVEQESGLADGENQRMQNGFTGNAMPDLKALESYVPLEEEEVSVIKMAEKPTETQYIASRYGGIYKEAGFWETEADNEVSDEEYQYPESLVQLISLCDKEEGASLEEAQAFITREFEDNTVYDYNPGKTPEEKDFAEYFLFDNKKGFCVHFATTAVLMYRILGFPARYAEGVAIPASAFEQAENGSFQAKVTGSMRHAWCETYDDGWRVREHTLSYTGTNPRNAGDALAEDKDTEKKLSAIFIKAGILIFIFLLLAVLIMMQAAVRKVLKRRKFRILEGGTGIHQMYLNIYKIAVFQGMNQTDPLSEDCFSSLQKKYPEVEEEEWNWLKAKMLGSLFYTEELNRQDNNRMYHIYRRIAEAAKEGERGFHKFQYKYWLCMD